MKVTGNITYTKVRGSVIIGTYCNPGIPDDMPDDALKNASGLGILNADGTYILTK